MPTTDDPYIASLKAEIEDLRADRDDLLAACLAWLVLVRDGHDWAFEPVAYGLTKAAVAKATIHV